jgi:hypothetical protein
MAAGNFGPALRRNGLAAKLRNVHEIGQTSDATRNTRACARVMGFYSENQDMTLASNQPSPNRRKGRRLCGAKTRAGGCCQVRAEPGKAR